LSGFISKYSFAILSTIIVFCYVFLGYFFERNQFPILLILYSITFICSYVLIEKSKIDAKKLFYIGLVFRVVFLFSTPFLSQDFFRFIWDGRMIVSGLNPYEYLPKDIINTIVTFPEANILYNGMGDLSAQHYSNYPPINQLLFTFTALVSGKSILGSVIVFRIIIILADIGIFYFGKKILAHLNQNQNKIFWYFLNPLVVIELTGNLHFEGVMLFFLVAGLYYLIINRWHIAAVFIAFSISVKLLPLLLLPLFWKKVSFKKSIVFYIIIIGLNVLFFVPFINQNLISNYLETISLWFYNFEFNASFYYVVREIGYYVKGYNIIGLVGKILPILTIAIALIFAFFRKNNINEKLFDSMLLFLTIYFFMSTTVHPWYIVNLIVLGLFTRYNYQLVWSLMVILSYYAYSQIDFKENMMLVFIEYFIVFGLFVYQLKSIKNFNEREIL
jgi:alpha-1,6-mannosyltransferase